MTKEITKSIILQAIQDKLGLREYEPANFLFDEMVVPTYDIGPHLSEWHVKTSTNSITSAVGFVFFDVPVDKQWTLRGYYILFLGSGAIEVSGLFIKRMPENESLYLDLAAGHTVSYIVNLPQHVVLPPKTQVGLLIDTYISTQNLTLKIDVKEETIR